MPVFYIDTSALVKRYRTEQGTGVVEVLLSDPRPEDRFFLSFLSVIELTSGNRRRDPRKVPWRHSHALQDLAPE